MDFGIAMRDKLIELKCDSKPIAGCTEAQIEEIMKAQKVVFLPRLYKQFLRVLGQSSGDLYWGTDAHYYYLPKLKDWGKDLLIENEVNAILPDDAFVFLMHQGYQFTHFRTADKNEDPAVFHYIEDEDVPFKKYDYLSEFLTAFIAERESEEAQAQFLAQFKHQSA